MSDNHQIGICVEGENLDCLTCHHVPIGECYHMVTVKQGKDTETLLWCSSCWFKKVLDSTSFNCHTREELQDYARTAQKSKRRIKNIQNMPDFNRVLKVKG